MSAPLFPCPRCGEPQDAVNVTGFGDKEPRYVMGLACPCPRPRCPFSHGTLDEQSRCPDVDCFMWMTVIPIPEMA